MKKQIGITDARRGKIYRQERKTNKAGWAKESGSAGNNAPGCGRNKNMSYQSGAISGADPED